MVLARRSLLLIDTWRCGPTSSAAYNNFAWFFATCPVAELRNPHRAVELARRLTEMLPNRPEGWNTLGVALLRAARLARLWMHSRKPWRCTLAVMASTGSLSRWPIRTSGNSRRPVAGSTGPTAWTVDDWYFHIELRNIRNEAAAYLGIPSPSYDDLGRFRDEILSAPANPSDH